MHVVDALNVSSIIENSGIVELDVIAFHSRVPESFLKTGNDVFLILVHHGGAQLGTVFYPP